mmetsp:Transcript_331/g.780  ORF Transcript_331/g.780 Transcript_331/m.780 type:complete len:140 (-) Transcript_331:599-1018(-)
MYCFSAIESLILNMTGTTPYPNATTPNQLLAADKSSGIRFISETLAKPANPFSDNPCHDMTPNDNARASNPITENFDKKLMSGAQERSATIMLGRSKSNRLDPVVSGISSMKLIIATSYAISNPTNSKSISKSSIINPF